MKKVVIQECKDYSLDKVIDKINLGIDILGGWDKFVKANDKVLLKVNLIGPKKSESAAITHCEFTRAVVRILKDKGCIVWVGDSSGGAIAGIAPTAQSFQNTGYLKMAEEEGIEVKNFDREGVVEVMAQSNLNEKMYLAKPIFDADVVINLPKLKTHSAAIYTGALKNVFGCIPGLRKAMYHKTSPDQDSFAEVISDIHSAGRFHLHIMDGITSMQGEGPTAGEVYESHKILISEDPVALDTVAVEMLNLHGDNVPIIKVAKRRGLGEGDLQNISIEGDFKTIPKFKGFILPKKVKTNFSTNSRSLSFIIDLLKARPIINISKCKRCNMCVESCPVKAIDKETKKINYDNCIECMCCHELCMYKAVEIKSNTLIGRIVTGIYNKK